MNRQIPVAGCQARLFALVVSLGSCTAPNPNYNRVTLIEPPGSDARTETAMIGDADEGTGGAAGFGGFDDGGVAGTAGSATGGFNGGAGGAGGSGGADAQAPYDLGPSPPADARVDALAPMDMGGATDTVVVVDARVDATAPVTDAAAPMDMVRPADARADAADVAVVMDTTAPVTDVVTAPDAASASNGLRGDYYSGENFNQWVFERNDPRVDFTWIRTSPDPRLSEDNFSVRWTGYVEPRYTGTYAFSTVTDDGVRLWIDGVNYIDNWSTQSGIEHTATVNVVANRRYAIRMEFYDRAYTASAQLFWRTTANALQPKEIIPYTRLWTP